MDQWQQAEVANALETVRIAEIMKANAAAVGDMTKFDRWHKQGRAAAGLLAGYGVTVEVAVP